MTERYDYIILGSGFVECAMASILSKKGKKVILIDRNGVYGSELATLRYSQLVELYNKQSVKELLDLDREFCIDLTPKLLLADSEVVKLVVEHKVDDCVEFINIPGSFIYKDKLHSVPTNETQSLKTGLVGFWEKYSVMKFFWDVRSYATNVTEGKSDAKTFKNTMREEYDGFGLSESVREFIGHAIALNLDDSYLDKHPKVTYDRICLYVRSILSFGDSLKSPYIYPRYGISEIIQGFARSACINGAEVMLRAKVEGIDPKKNTIRVIEPVNNSVLDITAPVIIADPSYAINCKEGYEIIRAIVITKGDSDLTRRAPSSQVIFLKSELKRKNDVFLVVLGKGEEATPEGYKVCIISTVKETKDPEKEIESVINKLGEVVDKFIDVKQVVIPDESNGNIIYTRGVDESPHFESLYEEIQEIQKALFK
ncbi:Rab GDP-dissociation inhibitor [Nosema granulosis]|uniref:Rab GDP dissociation inhibitor n=1 Tax=Nosema granulosis TaxID=83296 RepID=A0A9P6GYG3_9MICR|nr:Rab GDP-dissociation inhibitor [Nosema granulosis]